MTEIKNNQKLSIKKNFILNFLNRIVLIIAPLITTPYVSRILEANGIGQYSFSYTIVSYFIVFASLGFDLYGQREISKYEDDYEKKSTIFWEISICKFLCTLICSICLVTFLLLGLFGKYNILIGILSIELFSIAFDVNFLFQGNENYENIAIRNILLRTIGIASIFFFVKTVDDLDIYALISGLVFSVNNLCCWFFVHKYVKFVPLKTLKPFKHFKPSFCLFIPTLAASLYSLIDKTLITVLLANSDYYLGCYEQANKLIQMAITILTSISAVFFPRNTYDFSQHNFDALKKHLMWSINLVLFLALPLFAGTLILSDNIVAWFLGSGYESSPLIMRILSVLFIFVGLDNIIGYQYLLACGDDKSYTIAISAGAVINCGLTALFLYFWGVSGAAIGSIISELVILLIEWELAKRKFGFISLKEVMLASVKKIIATIIMSAIVSILYFVVFNKTTSFLLFLLMVTIGLVTYMLILFLLKDSFLLDNSKIISSKAELIFKKKKK